MLNEKTHLDGMDDVQVANVVSVAPIRHNGAKFGTLFHGLLARSRESKSKRDMSLEDGLMFLFY